MLSRLAGGVSDEQFLEVARLESQHVLLHVILDLSISVVATHAQPLDGKIPSRRCSLPTKSAQITPRLVHTVLVRHLIHLIHETEAARPHIPRMLMQEQPSCISLRLVHTEKLAVFAQRSTRFPCLTSLNVPVTCVTSIKVLKAWHIGEPSNQALRHGRADAQSTTRPRSKPKSTAVSPNLFLQNNSTTLKFASATTQ